MKTGEQQVEIDSRVEVRFQSGEIMSCVIANSYRQDPNHNIISCDSPLGKALLGKKRGDTICYRVHDRVFQADIVEICPGNE